jgi:hypothetical protein
MYRMAFIRFSGEFRNSVRGWFIEFSQMYKLQYLQSYGAKGIHGNDKASVAEAGKLKELRSNSNEAPNATYEDS